MKTANAIERTEHKGVDFLNNESDWAVALYGALGFSTKFLMEKSGLTKCQVTYRLPRAGLTTKNGTSRVCYRNGTSPFCRPILQYATPWVKSELTRYLRKYST